MGALSSALSAPSAYAAKKTPLWSDLADRVAAALLPADLDAFEQWLADYPLAYPGAWSEPLADLIEQRRAEIEAENISQIMRDRFDF